MDHIVVEQLTISLALSYTFAFMPYKVSESPFVFYPLNVRVFRETPTSARLSPSFFFFFFFFLVLARDIDCGS
jgi:hypothetical protein